MQFNPIVPNVPQSVVCFFLRAIVVRGPAGETHRAPAAPYHVARACRMFVVTGKG